MLMPFEQIYIYYLFNYCFLFQDKDIFQLQEEIKDQQDEQKRLSHALQEQTR